VLQFWGQAGSVISSPKIHNKTNIPIVLTLTFKDVTQTHKLTAGNDPQRLFLADFSLYILVSASRDNRVTFNLCQLIISLNYVNGMLMVNLRRSPYHVWDFRNQLTN